MNYKHLKNKIDKFFSITPAELQKEVRRCLKKLQKKKN